MFLLPEIHSKQHIDAVAVVGVARTNSAVPRVLARAGHLGKDPLLLILNLQPCYVRIGACN